MSEALEIRANEQGVTRVFAVNLPEREAAKLSEPEEMADALGAAEVDPARAELIDTRALDSIGLSAYLTEGMGVPEEEVGPDRARLDALDGSVLILASGAVAGGQRLRPDERLTLVAAYREQAARPDLTPLRSASAEGRLGAGGAPTVQSGRHGSRLAFGIVLLLLVLAAVVLFAAL